MMFARCPACQTVFRVRPEQLRAHLGRVRCGKCLTPFDALANLIDDAAAPSPSDNAGSGTGAPADDFFVLEERRDAPATDGLDFEIPDALVPRAMRDHSPLRPTSAAADQGIAPDDDPLQFIEPPAPQRAGEADRGDITPPPEAAAPPDDAAVQAEPPPEPDETTEESFDSAATDRGADTPDTLSAPPLEHLEQPAPPHDAPAVEASRPEDNALDQTYGPSRRPDRYRSLGGLAVGLLGGMLAAQSIYLFRSEIARDWPALRPALVAACAPLRCTIPLPRVVSEIGVAASELQAEPGARGRYVLHATLRNRAPHPQAFPHLELTLTDRNERALARRVLTPAEWAPDADLQQGFAAASEIAASLPFATVDLDAAGYRIYIFYP